MKHFNIRVGHGFDAHAFISGRPLVLGGVVIPYEKGLAGHSDADAIIHATMDALLGAAGLGDIGTHFPDSAPEYANISSIILLEKVVQMLENKHYYIGNIDITVIAQRPKINQYVTQMQRVMAPVLHIPIESISIKATTTEKMGFTGREEGVAAMATALIGF